MRTISHHFLHIKLYDVIGKSIVFIQSVPRFIRGAFFNTKLKRVDIVGFNYKQQYAVVVMCKDESEQEAVYNRLKAEGFKLKVVAV